MKNIVLFTVISLFALAGNAQKVVEKTFSFSGKESLKMNVQISDSIGIATWNKNEVYIKATINIDSNRYNDEYKIKFDETGNAIVVDGKYESDRHKKGNNNNCCNVDIEVLWTVFIPENARFSVETINGNITIVGKTEEVQAYTISGFIDMAVPASRKADFQLSTITGTVYSDILDNGSGKTKKHTNDISGQYNGGGKPVNLKTISGDIYLRKG